MLNVNSLINDYKLLSELKNIVCKQFYFEEHLDKSTIASEKNYGLRKVKQYYYFSFIVNCANKFSVS